MDLKIVIENEALARRLLDTATRETVFAVHKRCLESILNNLIEQRNNASDIDKPGLTVAVEALLTYLQALRDSFSK